MTRVGAIGLFSGGLDSILACRVVASLDIQVTAVQFVSPFFDDALLDRREAYRAEVRDKYGIDVRIVDISREYIELLKNPKHGYGKHFNPCIDCKIFMLTRARELMAEHGASFLVTGEVLGQRPMSQRRDTLFVIERESGCHDILLRPLCARLLNETLPEKEGLVDRQRLYGFSGRGRGPQMELARKFGISEYPNPAAGCVLTDPQLGARIEKFYEGHFFAQPHEFQPNDIRLLLVGRQFRLSSGHWFILGRNEKENQQITRLRGQDDWLFEIVDRPGPTGLLRRAAQLLAGTAKEGEVTRQAADLVARYSRKIDGRPQPAQVRIDTGAQQKIQYAEPLDDNRMHGRQL